MAEKSEVYLLRIGGERGYKISLREVGTEQSHTFGSLEALLDYLRYKEKQTSNEGRNPQRTEKGIKG